MAVLISDDRTAISADTATASVKALFETMYFLVETTDATGTSLDVEVQWSIDGTTWFSFSTPDDFAQITATGETWLGPVAAKAPFLRLNYVFVGGAFDFKLAGIGF